MFLLPVHQVREFATGLFDVALERRGYRFVPGECAVLFNDGADSRPYSLASHPDAETLHFLIRRISGGAVSPWLASRKPGDGVRISLPFGQFRPAQERGGGASTIFIATGVGIAPFLSTLAPEAAPRCGGNLPYCLYGVRHLADAVALGPLRAQTHLRLAVSRETVAGCHHGRVTDLLADIPHDATTHFYLCGLDAMVDDAAAWLQRMGVDGGRVHTEVFFSRAP